MSITVIIPAYNAAQFIDDAIASVVAQEYPASEIIVCDDGSTDDTAIRARAWERRTGTTRLIVLSHQNGGVSVARNYGILAATGNAIAFLDADDIFYPDHLSTLWPALSSSPNTHLAFSDMVYEGGQTHGRRLLDPIRPALLDVSRAASDRPGIWLADHRLRAIWLRKRRIAPSSWLIRREAVARIGAFDPHLPYAEDTKFLHRAMSLGDVLWCERATGAKRQHSDNATSNINAERNEACALRSLVSIRQSDNQLSPDEILAINAEIDLASHEMGYLASGRGLGNYIKTRREIQNLNGRRSPISLRHVLRAVLATIDRFR